MRGFAVGLNVQPTLAGAEAVKVSVRGSRFDALTTAGIVLGKSASAVLDGVRVSGAPVGLRALGAAKVAGAGVTLFGNGTGLLVEEAASVNLSSGTIAQNTLGVDARAQVHLADVLVTGNATGISGPVQTSSARPPAIGNDDDGTVPAAADGPGARPAARPAERCDPRSRTCCADEPSVPRHGSSDAAPARTLPTPSDALERCPR